MKERTLLIIKPDAYQYEQAIRERLDREGFRIVLSERRTLQPEQAAAFYAEHRGRPYFDAHIRFMSSFTCSPLVLEAEDAVLRLRKLVGATNPKEAEPGTLRYQYGAGLPRNAVHASDSVAQAQREIHFFFTGLELGEELLPLEGG